MAVSGTTVNPATGQPALASESSLSKYAGPYVTEMLGRGQALGSEAYNPYTGPLTAGASDLQNQAFGGIGSLNLPTSQMGTFAPSQFTAQNAADYMNPYLTAALQPQIDEARRQSEIDRIANNSRLTQSGAFGGSRQAIMDSENQRNLQQNLAGITGAGYSDAYDKAMNQYNVQQGREQTAQGETNKYGLAAIQKLYDMGSQKRGIESEGVAADMAQFKEERDYPYKQVQYMQSLLQDLPIGTTSTIYQQPTAMQRGADTSQSTMNFLSGLLNPSTSS
tara:strand:+ start:569 stop:1402 length:834 start_codon:yes stop_codon:yes gene_type:complete